MNYFYYIHKNLYEMYFKEHAGCKNQYDYFDMLYNFRKNEKSVFEHLSYNKYKIADKWLKNGSIDGEFFTYDNDNLLLKNDLFEICHNNINDIFCKASSSYILKQLLNSIVYNPISLKYSFMFRDDISKKLCDLFVSVREELFFVTLILFAQTGRMIESSKKNEISHNMIEVYNKSDITHSFNRLIDGAIEINMMQISTPSLIKKYTDFFKPNNYKSLICALNNGCIINFLFIDPETDFSHELTNVYCYGNTFNLFGNVIKDSIEFARELKKNYPKQINIKTTNYPISYSLMIIKKRDLPAIAKVDLYLIKKDADSRQSFIFNSENNMDSYSLYRNNFYEIYDDPNNKNIS